MTQNIRTTEATLVDAYTSIVQEIATTSCFSEAERKNLEDSGPRIARGVQEMIWPRFQIEAAVAEALSTLFPVSDSCRMLKQPIMVGPIDTYSLCPHHLLPIVNRVHVSYVPEGVVIGLSKLPRIIDALAHRAVVQEQYTADIVNVLTTGGVPGSVMGKPLSSSVAVNVRAVHHCMICRGVKGQALTETEIAVGEELRYPESRAYQMFSRFISMSGT